jgi:hypothetical protein
MAAHRTAPRAAEHRQIGRAWLALCLALALHVFDEASTGFLGVYNPTVTAIRAQAPWFPLPVFRFETWITGLIAVILALICMSGFVWRGARWTRPAAYAFAILMIVNALGHTAGTIFGRSVESVRFPRPMPGFYSSPVLLAAAIYLLLKLRPVSRSGSARP